MTRSVQIYSKTEFSAWLKRFGPQSDEFLDAVDIQDIDFVVFAYLIGDIMTLEVKERNGRSSSAQKDTQNIIRQLLMLSHNSTCHTKRGIRTIKYHGHHLIQFENTTPDNGWTKLDGKLISREELRLFLNFGKPLKEFNNVLPTTQD